MASLPPFVNGSSKWIGGKPRQREDFEEDTSSHIWIGTRHSQESIVEIQVEFGNGKQIWVPLWGCPVNETKKTSKIVMLSLTQRLAVPYSGSWVIQQPSSNSPVGHQEMAENRVRELAFRRYQLKAPTKGTKEVVHDIFIRLTPYETRYSNDTRLKKLLDDIVLHAKDKSFLGSVVSQGILAVLGRLLAEKTMSDQGVAGIAAFAAPIMVMGAIGSPGPENKLTKKLRFIDDVLDVIDRLIKDTTLTRGYPRLLASLFEVLKYVTEIGSRWRICVKVLIKLITMNDSGSKKRKSRSKKSLLRQSSADRIRKKRLTISSDKLFIQMVGKEPGCNTSSSGVLIARLVTDDAIMGSVTMGIRSANITDFYTAVQLLNACYRRIYTAALPYTWYSSGIESLEATSPDIFDVYEEATTKSEVTKEMEALVLNLQMHRAGKFSSLRSDFISTASKKHTPFYKTCLSACNSGLSSICPSPVEIRPAHIETRVSILAVYFLSYYFENYQDDAQKYLSLILPRLMESTPAGTNDTVSILVIAQALVKAIFSEVILYDQWHKASLRSNFYVDVGSNGSETSTNSSRTQKSSQSAQVYLFMLACKNPLEEIFVSMLSLFSLSWSKRQADTYDQLINDTKSIARSALVVNKVQTLPRLRRVVLGERLDDSEEDSERGWVTASKKVKRTLQNPITSAAKLSPLQRAINEFIETEGVYRDSLDLLDTVFHMPIKYKGDLSDITMTILFGNVQRVNKVAKKLLEDWGSEKDKHLTSLESANTLANIFIQNGPFFEAYAKYCAGYPKALSKLQELLNTNRGFVETLRVCETDPACNGLTITDFIIKPVQRICKYPLLFKEIIKCLDKDEEHATLKGEDVIGRVEVAMRESQKLADMANDLTKKSENSLRKIKIWRNIVGGNHKTAQELLMAQKAIYIKEGSFEFGGTRVLLFLFNYFMLIAKIKQGKKVNEETFAVKFVSTLDKVRFISPVDCDSGLEFEFEDRDKVVRLTALSSNEKTVWLSLLKTTKTQLLLPNKQKSKE